MIVTISRGVIDSNRKHHRYDPPISVRKTRSGPVVYRTNVLTLDAGARIVYSPDEPLSCGARLWIETP